MVESVPSIRLCRMNYHSILDLARTEARGQTRELVVTASLAGASNALVIALVDDASRVPPSEQLRSFVMIGLAVVLYVVCARRIFHRTTAVIEAAVVKMKLRLVTKIEKAELQDIEGIGSSVVYDRLTENATAISESAGHIANVLQSSSVVIFAAFYILSTSLPGFVLLALLIFAGIMLWSTKNFEIREHLRRASTERVKFLEQLTDLLKGFKEIRFSRRRASDIVADIETTAIQSRAATVAANNLFNDNHVLSQCILFALLVAVVFVLPQNAGVDSSTVTKLVAGVLFFWGPLGNVVGSMPMYIRSNDALKNIRELEIAIDNSARNQVPATEAVDPWTGRFTTIDVKSVRFSYAADAGGRTFHIGPMNLSLRAAEVLFVVGGNGSGKSTFMKVLSGLYPPSSGEVRIDGRRLEPANVAAYREMFSAIFSDFHLFARLYGLLDVDEKRICDLLQQMDLDDKTSFANGGFTKRDLSTGQRKRLAMIVALLEDRPIFLFDEWAADQDPEFRTYFYETLIPSLKRRGKTVIAVSHDDRYFHCADRVVTLEDGQIRSIEQHRRPSSDSPMNSLPLENPIIDPTVNLH